MHSIRAKHGIFVSIFPSNAQNNSLLKCNKTISDRKAQTTYHKFHAHWNESKRWQESEKKNKKIKIIISKHSTEWKVLYWTCATREKKKIVLFVVRPLLLLCAGYQVDTNTNWQRKYNSETRLNDQGKWENKISIWAVFAPTESLTQKTTEKQKIYIYWMQA